MLDKNKLDKEKVLGRNTLYNYIGLILSLTIYCNVYSDPSVVGWYLTFAIFPMFFLPLMNLLFMSWFYNKSTNNVVLAISLLTIPVSLLYSYLKITEFIVLLWALTFIVVNLLTIQKIRKRRITPF